MRRSRSAVLGLIGAGLLLASCSSTTTSGSSSSSTTASGSTGSTGSTPGSTPGGTTGTSRPGVTPKATAATVAGPLTGGKGIFLGAASAGPDLDAHGYREAEYSASGTASSYKSAGELPPDGTFSLSPDATASYATRFVVRRPKEQKDFNGTVVVEWLNVSGGVDAAPDYTYVNAEILRKGYAWVGVSAQRIGIEGGPILVEVPGAAEQGAGKGIKAIDPARYGQLSHPGDAFAYDIFTQVAQSLREPGSVSPLEGLDVQRVFAMGESQSAFTLTTYYDGVQPLTHEFDAFFIHSRGGTAAPLGTPGGGIDVASSLQGKPTKLRTDQPIPAIVVETETDVTGLLSFYPARQPDNDHLRIWEIAGTAHADAYQIGPTESMLGCPTPVNRGQQYAVLRAALRGLQTWVTTGEAPPKGEPLATDGAGAKPGLVLDAVGNATGGVRTPVLDAPVDRLTGIAGEGASVICLLLGTTTPLTAEQLATLYTGQDDYVAKYGKATDAAIAAGFALAEDRDEILQGADPSRVEG